MDDELKDDTFYVLRMYTSGGAAIILKQYTVMGEHQAQKDLLETKEAIKNEYYEWVKLNHYLIVEPRSVQMLRVEMVPSEHRDKYTSNLRTER